MPLYLFFCPVCMHRYQSLEMADTTCRQCGGEARRDWKQEAVTSNFHPTRDLYGNDVKRRAAKREDRFF